MDLKSKKTRARLQAKVRRAYADNDAASVELLKHFPIDKFRSKVIAGFWPMGNEIDIRLLLHNLSDMGEALCLPSIARKGHPLVFRCWTSGDDLKRGPHGTREPLKGRNELRPDIILVPLLAFTDQGDRIGYGGGYYDRTLTVLKARRDVFACGVAYAAQQADYLPVDDHDVRLDGLLTENGFTEF